MLFASPALAQTETASVVVRYADLKMDAPGALQVVERRIDRAAARVCGDQPDIRDLDRRVAFDACRADATHRAVSQLRATSAFAQAHGAGISPLARR